MHEQSLRVNHTVQAGQLNHVQAGQLNHVQAKTSCAFLRVYSGFMFNYKKFYL